MRYNKAIDSYISYLLEPHEVRTHKEYPDSIFWVKGQETIVEIRDSEYFWVHYDIWNSISRMFELNYNGTQSVIKIWLEQHPNFGGLTPWISRNAWPSRLEQHPNFGGLTPWQHPGIWLPVLEQHPNLGGLTPFRTDQVYPYELGQHYNL